MSDALAVIGVFMLGASAGALLTWIALVPRLRELNRVIHDLQPQTKRENVSDGIKGQHEQDSPSRKSA